MQYSLKELRARHNLTLQDMANKLGLSYQSYCAWEKNISNVKLSNVMRVAEILQVQVSEIKL